MNALFNISGKAQLLLRSCAIPTTHSAQNNLQKATSNVSTGNTLPCPVVLKLHALF